MSIFKLPDLGEGLQEADIREWLVKVGDEVKVDQPLVSVETAKAVVEVPSPVTGRIARLCAADGDTVEVGKALVEFEGDEEVQAAPAPATAKPKPNPTRSAIPAWSSAP